MVDCTSLEKKISSPAVIPETERETRLLMEDDPSVVVLQCGTAGYENGCNTVKNINSCPTNPDPTPLTEYYGPEFTVGDDSIHGNHQTCQGNSVDTGTDKYRITLKNGWTIRKVNYS